MNFGLAIRRLRRSPTFSLFAIATAGFGIAAVATVHAVVSAVMLKPPAHALADRMVYVFHAAPPASLPVLQLSWLDYLDLQRQASSFERLAAVVVFRQELVANGWSRSVVGEAVDGDYFGVLGDPPMTGRLLQAADMSPGAPSVMVISYALWRNQFGADPAVVGRTVTVGARPVEIVGVAQPVARGIAVGSLLPADVWLPLETATALRLDFTRNRDRMDRAERWLLVIGTLRADHRLATAADEVERVGRRLDQVAPFPKRSPGEPRPGTERAWKVVPFSSVPLSPINSAFVRPAVILVEVLVLIVLVVMCSNVGSLMLARLSDRRLEMGIRTSLGASRGRLVWELAAESLVLGSVSALVALTVSPAVMKLLQSRFSVGEGLQLQIQPQLDVSVVLMTGVATMTSMFVLGLIPAWRATRSRLDVAGPAFTRPHKFGRSLVVIQVAISTCILAVSVGAIAKLIARERAWLGFDVDRLAVLQSGLDRQDFPEGRARDYVTRMLEIARTLDGVESAAVTTGLPGGLSGAARAYLLEERTPPVKHPVSVIATSPGALEVLGVQVLFGRGIAQQDLSGGAVAILSRSAASGLDDPKRLVGQSVRLELPRRSSREAASVRTLTVIGVVESSRSGATGREAAEVYVPLGQWSQEDVHVVARVTTNPSDVLDRLRSASHQVDPDVAIRSIGTAASLRSEQTRGLQVAAALAGALGGAACLVALSGLAGLLTHMVIVRVREFAIRIAIGARPGAITALILREGLTPVAAGLILGVALGAVGRMCARVAFVGDLPLFDRWSVLLLPAAILGAALLSCLVPSGRASSVDPAFALKDL